jgi:hypothetical protein
MSMRFERGLAAALGLVLTGCADAPTTSATYRSPDARTFAEYAMSIGPMLVRIQGSPYATPTAKTEEVVLGAMSKAMSWATPPRLTTDPAAARMRSMVVVMTNGGAVDARAQCRGESEGGEPQPQGAVQVAASFCGDGTLISNTTGRIGASSGVDDPQFAELVRQVARDLFPQSEQPLGTGIGLGGGRSGFSFGTGGIGIHF